MKTFKKDVWDFRFSRRWRYPRWSSGLWRRVDLLVGNNRAEDGDSTFLRNLGTHLQARKTSQPRRPHWTSRKTLSCILTTWTGLRCRFHHTYQAVTTAPSPRGRAAREIMKTTCSICFTFTLLHTYMVWGLDTGITWAFWHTLIWVLGYLALPWRPHLPLKRT
jgi:hypothetical protein